MHRCEAKVGGEVAIDGGGRGRGIADVDDLVLGGGQRIAQVAKHRGLAQTSNACEESKARLGGEPVEVAPDGEDVIRVQEARLTAGVAGHGVVREAETNAVTQAHRCTSPSVVAQP